MQLFQSCKSLKARAERPFFHASSQFVQLMWAGLMDEKINVYSRLADWTAARFLKIHLEESSAQPAMRVLANAGVAQLVERNLAKVEVA
ncbi:hypothetical protein, partial [Achromobacter animicus]|uniref:hypothetical protein n=1 Tax=Achromobacter animicus TaxID=1389935 RepID=UPI0028A5827B